MMCTPKNMVSVGKILIHLPLFVTVIISEHFSRGYPHINFRLLFIYSKSQTPVSQRAINFLEVMAIARVLQATLPCLFSLVLMSPRRVWHRRYLCLSITLSTISNQEHLIFQFIVPFFTTPTP